MKKLKDLFQAQKKHIVLKIKRNQGVVKMKWYRTKEANYLSHEVIAFFMRENNYSNYKNAKFTTKYVDGNYIVILYNENENI